MPNATYQVEIRDSPSGLTPIGSGIERTKILEFQRFLGSFKQEDYPLKHYFVEEQYGREITIPAGQLVVGKIHKHGHLNFISKGECTVVTEFGSYRIKAPHTFISEPGTKRALYTHSETIWTTIHTTAQRDLDVIEKDLIAPTFEDFDAFMGIIACNLKPELEENGGII